MPAVTFSGDDLHDNSRSSLTNQMDGSISPQGPPYSPITPVLPTATLAPASTGYGQVPPTAMLEQPPLIPISESDNPDAIALRSAISILQMQRLQSIRNLRLLEKQKAVAVANPETFAKDLASGKIQSASRTGILASGPTSSRQPEYSNEDDSAEPDRNETKFQGNPVDIPIPGPQNIVRCPPINWAKYHVVGEALDKLHNEQRSRPIAGEPQIDRRQQQASEHLIAAPYRPWTDQLLDAPVKTRDPPRKKL